MPKAFPEEFRRDVVAVARKGESTMSRSRRTLVFPMLLCIGG